MKTKDIIPGKTYMVHVDERTSYIYLGCDLRARVVRAGFHYQVETVTGSAIRGAPYKRHHESAYPNGVEIEWDDQEVWGNRRFGSGKETVRAGRAIVNARAVKYEIEEDLSKAADERFIRLVAGDLIRTTDDATKELEEAELICWDADLEYFVMTHEGSEFAAKRGLH